MSGFLNACVIEVVDDSGFRPRVRLIDHLHFSSEQLGTVIVPRGFECDLASVPALASIAGISPTTGARAAIVHDWLLTSALPRSAADDVFSEALAHCGVDDHVALLMANAVRAHTRYLQQQLSLINDPHTGA